MNFPFLKKISATPMMLSALGVGLCPVCVEAQEKTGCGLEIHGVVLERFEGVEETFEIFEAKVTLLEGEEGPKLVRRGASDQAGAYQLTGLCPGVYRLRVEAPGYEAKQMRVELGGERVVHLEHSVVMQSEGPKNKVSTRGTQVRQSVRPSETLTGRELAKTRGQSLGESLKGLNGVTAIDTGTVSKPVIHGMHSNRVSIINDGLRLEAQSWGLDHAPEVDPSNAKRLTVVKGAAGVRYGANAIGGVILVDPQPLPKEGEVVSGEVYATGISNGWQGITGGVLQGATEAIKGLGWRVQGSVKKSGALQTPDFVLDNTGVQELNGSATVGIGRESWGASLSVSRFDSEVGVFTGLVTGNINDLRQTIEDGKPNDTDLYRFDYDIARPRQEVVHQTARGKAYWVAPGIGRLDVQVAYQQNDRQEYDLVRSNIEGPQLDFFLQTASTEVLWRSLGSDRWLWNVGLSGDWQDNIYKGRRLIPNYRSFAGGAFGWLTYIHSEHLEFEAGTRVEGEQMTSYQREAVGGASAEVNVNDFTFITPSAVLGMRARPWDGAEARWTVSSASRAPTINELFLDGVAQGSAGFLRGDESLSPEQTWASSLDLAWRGEHVELGVTPYLQWVDGYIYDAPQLGDDGTPQLRQTISGGFPSFAYQQVDALFYGADAMVKVLPISWLEVGAKGSWVRAKDQTNDNFLVYIPADTYSATVSFKRARLGPLAKLQWEAGASYTAQQTRFDPNADFAPPPEGYLLLDGSFDAEIPWSEHLVMSGGVGVKNLLDNRYRSYLSRQRYFAPEPGRSVIARMSLSF